MLTPMITALDIDETADLRKTEDIEMQRPIFVLRQPSAAGRLTA